MPHHTNIAERIVFGRPLEPAAARTSVMPRPTSALIGRILISAIFILSGIAKLTDTSGTVAHMEHAGIPAAHPLAIIAGIAELTGGVAILFGFLTRLAAIGLALFLIPTTLIFHHFWTLEGAERMPQMVNFMKNLTTLGGLMLLFAFGPGRYSIDALLRRPLEP